MRCTTYWHKCRQSPRDVICFFFFGKVTLFSRLERWENLFNHKMSWEIVRNCFSSNNNNKKKWKLCGSWIVKYQHGKKCRRQWIDLNLFFDSKKFYLLNIVPLKIKDSLLFWGQVFKSWCVWWKVVSDYF